MRRNIIAYAGAFVVFVFTGCRTEPAQLGGTWTLNVDKSDWGRVTRPTSVVVKVDHREPALTYSGTVTYANEEVRSFGFSGVIDGKQYPVTRSCGPGTMTVRWVNTFTLSSVFRSDDGQCVENVRTSISRNKLIRQLHSRAPSGEHSWTEVYDRQPIEPAG